MSLPVTLEEMQRDILTKDVSTNPFFQSSPIPTRDNKLKTTAQKIVHAINELIGRIDKNKESLDFFSVAANEKIETNRRDIATVHELCQDNVTAITQVTGQIQVHDQSITQLAEQVANGTGGGTEAPLALFFSSYVGSSRVELPKGLDLAKMKIVCFQQSGDRKPNEFNQYTNFKLMPQELTFKTSSTSVYEFEVEPYELCYNPVTDKYFIQTVRRSAYIYIYQ